MPRAACPAKSTSPCAATGMHSALIVGGAVLAEDTTPLGGPEAIRNHCLAATLPDGRSGRGRRWAMSAGGRSASRSASTAASSTKAIPARRIAYPGAGGAHGRRRLTVRPPGGFDPGQIQRNKVPLMVDIAARPAVLRGRQADRSCPPPPSSAPAPASRSIVAQRFVKVDLIGGLALFGIVMLLLSAGARHRLSGRYGR